MTQTNKKSKYHKIKNTTLEVGQYMALFFVLLLSLVTLYHVFLADRIIPGVEILGVKVGNNTPDQALNKLIEASDKKVSTTLKYTSADFSYDLPTSKLGLSYNWTETITKAFEVGRSNNPIVNTKNKMLGLVFPVQVEPVYTYDKAVLNNTFDEIESFLTKPAESAHYELVDQNLVIVEEVAGKRVDRQVLMDATLEALNNVSFNKIEVKTIVDKPEIVSSDIDGLQDEVAKLIANEITFKIANTSLEVSKDEDGGNETKDDDTQEVIKPVLEKPLISLTKEQKLSVIAFEKQSFNSTKIVIDPAALDDLSDEIATHVVQAPRGKVTKFTNSRVVSFELTQSGVDLDTELFQEILSDALLSNNTKEITLPIKKIEGSVDPEKYGIVAVIGEGKSSYKGSAAARAKNLILSSERAGGVLVPPQGIYSLNESVGTISSATGYDTAYIISNGRTVLGEGGGVCQSSTTMFRAALNAGLPIIERHPHAYRVTYYEQDQPAGFDAAIYQPSLDFKFKNDTPNWILVQTSYDTTKQELHYVIFGTPDGREVEISEPILTNQSPPPEARYEDDPSLPKGVVKQVDFAAWGAHSVFTRKVTRNGEVLQDNEFKSSYRPWQAVFLKGTKED